MRKRNKMNTGVIEIPVIKTTEYTEQKRSLLSSLIPF